MFLSAELSCQPWFLFLLLILLSGLAEPRQASTHSAPPELLILLPPGSQGWNHRCPSPHPAYIVLGIKPRILLKLGKLSTDEVMPPSSSLAHFFLGDLEVLGLREYKRNLLGDRHASCLLFFRELF